MCNLYYNPHLTGGLFFPSPWSFPWRTDEEAEEVRRRAVSANDRMGDAAFFYKHQLPDDPEPAAPIARQALQVESWMPHYAADLARFARQLAPELSALPVYVLYDRQLGFEARPDWRAFTRADMSWSLPGLLSADQWAGHGPVVILSAQHAATASGSGRLIHELGHVLALPWPHFDQQQPQRVRSLETAADCCCDAAGRQPLWHQHDATWVRATLHLAHRSHQIGQPVELSDCLDLRRYGLASPDEAYHVALAPELEDLSGYHHWATFDEIRQQPLPEAFDELWAVESLLARVMHHN